MNRFWEKVSKQANGCWVWTASKDKQGYGYFGFNGKVWKAHRVCWILTKGKFDGDLCVLHKCDNPSCVNPSHLFLGTRLDNNIDRNKKGRTHGGHGVVLTKQDIIKIRKDTRPIRAIGLDYNTSHTNISAIKTYKTWVDEKRK